MSSEQKPLSNNMAGIEFVACLEVIKEFLHKNWKHSQIHRHLKQEGKITMSYGAFCYHMRRLSMDKHRPGEAPPAAPAKPVRTPPVPPVRPSQPKIIKPSSDTLQDPRTVDPSTLF
ncbi:MAG: TraK family protein [Desulfovibrio fairfieldensis]|nr:TraK family protein [Desulfovibrio fairfieldensis]